MVFIKKTPTKHFLKALALREEGEPLTHSARNSSFS